MSPLTYHDHYGYPYRWALLAELCWRLELRFGGPFYRWRKACEHRGAP